ncbi:uncharacterized protein TRIADDRAFT_61047 [Trichoplax adhaerens]|uniref:Uncharacterized protein n=1 Tax=Trichoplax adhaerens TaxID=10228 RepID=B3S9W3_TRIAD|nr:hypothetical protein TRIADDRAFT_61047 [Trichoplax adhaerens]EDV20337.1 hypothetical protein TRIADDRAFT_61047 [Trichoplax adhaerens]|eukprot:XP_002117031.1 hypothetical protein TRIADDRAFT_61047 [Trichoplax adhaerens]
MVIQLNYQALCVISYLYSNSKNITKFKKIREYVFSVLAFPVSIIVTATFWILYIKNPNNVREKMYENIIPPHINHLFHTVIAIANILDLLMHHHDYPVRRNSYVGMALFSLSFITWTIWIKYRANIWAYKILHKIPTPILPAFFMSFLFMHFGLYELELWVKSKQTATNKLKNKMN